MAENGQTTDNKPHISLTFTEGYQVSASLRNVNPLMIWAAAEWLRAQADMLNAQQIMQQSQSSLDVVRSFPQGLKGS